MECPAVFLSLMLSDSEISARSDNEDPAAKHKLDNNFF